MPTYQQITSAREKAKRIRKCAHSFRLERLRMQGSTKDICGAISATSASEFITGEVL